MRTVRPESVEFRIKYATVASLLHTRRAPCAMRQACVASSRVLAQLPSVHMGLLVERVTKGWCLLDWFKIDTNGSVLSKISCCINYKAMLFLFLCLRILDEFYGRWYLKWCKKFRLCSWVHIYKKKYNHLCHWWHRRRCFIEKRGDQLPSKCDLIFLINYDALT